MQKAIFNSMMFGAFITSSVFAQSIWTANTTTGVPNFDANGTVKTTTVDTTVHGKGVRPRVAPAGYGTSHLYIPVTAPQNSTFACIGLRAMDNTPTGVVRAEFWRQPRNGNPAPAVLLGAVNTVDVFVPADGFQFQTAPFAAVPINYNLFTYYVRVVMSNLNTNSVVPGVTALDVSLSQTCN